MFKHTDKEGREKTLGKAHPGIDYWHLFPLKKSNITSFTGKHSLLSRTTNITLTVFFLFVVVQVIHLKYICTLQIVSAFLFFFLVLNPSLLNLLKKLNKKRSLLNRYPCVTSHFIHSMLQCVSSWEFFNEFGNSLLHLSISF